MIWRAILSLCFLIQFRRTIAVAQKKNVKKKKTAKSAPASEKAAPEMLKVLKQVQAVLEKCGVTEEADHIDRDMLAEEMNFLSISIDRVVQKARGKPRAK